MSGPRGGDYSALMLAARITLPHFSFSSTMNLPNSAGEPVSTMLIRNPRPLIPNFAGFLVLAVHLHDDTPNRHWGDRPSKGNENKGENTWPSEQAANS